VNNIRKFKIGDFVKASGARDIFIKWCDGSIIDLSIANGIIMSINTYGFNWANYKIEYKHGNEIAFANITEEFLELVPIIKLSPESEAHIKVLEELK